MKTILSWCIVVSCAISSSEGGENRKGVRSTALGFAGTVLPGDAWAVIHNPAVLSLKPETRISAYMTPSLFGLRELRTVAFCGTFTLAGRTASAFIEQFGFDLYREFNGIVGFGSSIGTGLSGGVALEWRRVAIKGYGASDALIITAGCVVDLSRDIYLGFLGHNIFGATIGIERQRLAQTAAMGVSYKPLPSILIVLEAEKDVRFSLTMKAGLEIQAFENLVLRSGIEQNPDFVTTGFSVYYGSAEFGYAAFVHSQLGWTHQIEISVRLEK